MESRKDSTAFLIGSEVFFHETAGDWDYAAGRYCTGQLLDAARYMEGLSEAGGLPVMLPLTADVDSVAQIADRYDGFLFTGGHDVSPTLYGEDAMSVCGECCPWRDTAERLLFQAAVARDKPILGICRGLQFINVMLGGTLYQDLPVQRPSDVIHRQAPPYDSPSHEVRLLEHSPLRVLLGRDLIAVNSCHHQGIKDLAQALQPMACAQDGLIEAAFHPQMRFLWAVQWHPEFSHLVDENSRRIFRSFVEAAV